MSKSAQTGVMVAAMAVAVGIIGVLIGLEATIGRESPAYMAAAIGVQILLLLVVGTMLGLLMTRHR